MTKRLALTIPLFIFFSTATCQVTYAEPSKLPLYLPAILGAVLTRDVQYGSTHWGQYHLGPVDFAETSWHNACAPASGYRQALRHNTGLGGEFLAGVSTIFSEGGGACDRCIRITTAAERTIIARVVTYGATNEPGDIDVSLSVYEALNIGEYPRLMSWYFTKCPQSGTIQYEFQEGAHIWWSSLWLRISRVPIAKVEVRSKNHQAFFPLTRGTDGTLTDNGGFGEGRFTLRTTAFDGQAIEDDFDSFPTGKIIPSSKQFE
jgi:hypothetical protein